MKLAQRLLASEMNDELIASFGQAKLLRNASGRLELKGGTDQEREQARWWVKTFLARADDVRIPDLLEY